MLVKKLCQFFFLHFNNVYIQPRAGRDDDWVQRMRVGEIATELCFTDESHLNRSFKKLKGMSPTAYRKKFLAVS